jgi:putative transposase
LQIPLKTSKKRGPFSGLGPVRDENLAERLNKEVKRRADVVGIFPNEASIIRLIGAVLLEANDEWLLQHRYMGVEAMAELLSPHQTNETLQIPPKAA